MSTASDSEARHPFLGALRGIRESLAQAAESPSWSPSDAEVGHAIEELLAARAQLEALVLEQVRQAESRALHAELHSSDTSRWLRRRFRLSRREATRLCALATSLPACPGTAEALRAGTISSEQAAAMASALAELPAAVPAREQERAEQLLVEQATTLDAEDLARCGRALREALTTAPDVDDPAEAARLAAEAERAAQRQHALSGLRLRERADGMSKLDGLLDPLTGAAVRAALEARAERRPSGDGVGDARTKAQRMADALHELALAGLAENTGMGTDPTLVPDLGGADGAAPDEPAGGRLAPAQVSLVVRYETLRALRPDAGLLEDGTALSTSQLLTALCDAAVLPLVFKGSAQPVRLGRRRRTFSSAQRAGIAARDRGCSYPGCHRPASRSAVHHMVHWAHGGPTDVDNGCLLCPYHHALVHREGWQARLGRNGYPQFVPPPAYDPLRRPRQHLRYRRTE